MGIQAARVQALLLHAGVGSADACRPCPQAVPARDRLITHSHIIRYMRLARPCAHMDARSEFDVPWRRQLRCSSRSTTLMW